MLLKMTLTTADAGVAKRGALTHQHLAGASKAYMPQLFSEIAAPVEPSQPSSQNVL